LHYPAYFFFSEKASANWTKRWRQILHFRVKGSIQKNEKGRIFSWINLTRCIRRSYWSDLSPNRVGGEWDGYIHSSLNESSRHTSRRLGPLVPSQVVTLPPAVWSSAEAQIRGNTRRIKPSLSYVSRDTLKRRQRQMEPE